MKLSQITPQVKPEIVAARSNGRDYALTVESPAGRVEIPVAESTYRRALIDFLSPEDIQELNQWLEERYVEVIEMHEAEYGEWPSLPPAEILDDMADANAQALTGIPSF